MQLKAEQSSGVERTDGDVDLPDEFVDLDITAGGGWSDGDRLVLRACIGVVKTAASAIRKVLNSLCTPLKLKGFTACLKWVNSIFKTWDP